ncbi:MAG: alginate lyase family protein, partial [Odoribacter sp.]
MSISIKIFRLWNTLKYLKLIQIYYRLRIYLCAGRMSKIQLNKNKEQQGVRLTFKKTIEFSLLNSGNSFVFLNCNKNFGEKIDWGFCGNGRLWGYNLNYFEYLDQQGMQRDEGIRLIQDFMDYCTIVKIGIEPYPLSLRCFNWIRFSIRHNYSDRQFVKLLYAQLNHLTLKLEYHLLGNHLLENGFALLFGAYYFNDARFYLKAKRILIPELKEQILKDGAHFELSPMYHSTILFRVLDCYNLISSNELYNKELEPLFRQVAERMSEWLNTISFRDGTIPLLNDAAFCIAPTVGQLNQYAKDLKLNISRRGGLFDSGYRKFEDEKFEFVFDVGKIGPDYQPGHSHADTFSFELHINGRPVIVDTGTSTYEANAVR